MISRKMEEFTPRKAGSLLVIYQNRHKLIVSKFQRNPEITLFADFLKLRALHSRIIFKNSVETGRNWRLATERFKPLV